MLLAHTTYMGSKQDVVTLIEMATTRAAKALELENYGLHIGAYADLILFESTNLRSAFYERVPRRYVWKRGLLVASTVKQTTFYNEQVSS